MTLAPLALVREGAAQLAEAGCETPQLDAEILVAHSLGTDRTGLRRMSEEPLGEANEAAARGLLARRAQREPVAQIVGYRWFRNIQVGVDSRVLTPRPETELLVEWGVGLPADARVADIGTGSGAIALALADERPDLQITASDVDSGALDVARANATRLGLEITFVQGDLLDAVDSELDALISNPPYISDSELTGLDPEVVDYEPHLALTAGPDGLETVERLVEQAALRKIPRIALEIGAGQADSTAALLAEAGWAHVEIRDDLAGIARVVIGDNSGDRI
ncbi:MAG: peptide chain release factor N(5)-glutamine methyltransferase [Actinobacteria bacterium]|uniref:peptide chain release factor N(5)-glutamine methyltransferase n=1 Tax=freshwater metagenome TaxID=449393 RepID=A0A6J7D6X4_9ZZZZ|nr:peptide chain release factor N(5)-glutamine methyltransferase [Actinomycetota bacterium]